MTRERAPRLLIAEDDAVMSALLCEYLEQHGYSITVVHDGESAANVGARGGHALVVLDVVLPGRDGFAALRDIRRASGVPVIMLSDRGGEADRILGLELGADDYVAKPCAPREILARVRAVLRRTQPEMARLTVGALVVSAAERSAQWRGRSLVLTLAQFNLLSLLARHAGEVVTKRRLCEQALGRPLGRFDRAVDAHMSAIRQKLGDGGSLIRTVRGVGYRLSRD
ncbi:MAG: response regulator transcription factor [Burkholderiales bacterium]